MSTMTKETRRALRRVREVLAKGQTQARVGLHIEFPCPVAWETMTPVAEGVRHCDTCAANVHDLRGASKGDILARIRAHGAPLCGQVNAREDGRIVFGPCCAPNENIRGMLVVD
jgi:hypothetical protein